MISKGHWHSVASANNLLFLLLTAQEIHGIYKISVTNIFFFLLSLWFVLGTIYSFWTIALESREARKMGQKVRGLNVED